MFRNEGEVVKAKFIHFGMVRLPLGRFPPSCGEIYPLCSQWREEGQGEVQMGSWAEQAGLSRAGFSGRIPGGGGELLPLGPSPAPLPVLRAVGQASKNGVTLARARFLSSLFDHRNCHNFHFHHQHDMVSLSHFENIILNQS